jgi:hypothetical protein
VHAVEARAPVRDRLRAAGVDAKLGGINRFNSIADVLDGEGRAISKEERRGDGAKPQAAGSLGG